MSAVWAWMKAAEPYVVIFNAALYAVLVFHLQRSVYRLERRTKALETGSEGDGK